MLPISVIPDCLQMFSKQFSSVFNHPAQERHFGEYLSGLIASGNRTIAGIHQRVPSDTAYDSLQHFMTDSPWSVDDMKEKRLKWIKDTVPADQDALTVIAIDSTFAHHTSEKIHGVYWYWDYAQELFCLAQRAVVSTLVTTLHLVPLGIQIYHRGFLNEQKLYLEETKPKDDATPEEKSAFQELLELFEQNKKEHKTQLQIAAELVDECEKIGLKKNAYVLDAAFLDKNLMGKIEDYQQAWVTRLPKSRLVQVAAGGFETVETFAKSLPKDAFTRTVVKTRHGEERIYWCFCKNMMLKNWYKKKRVVVSYDNENLDGEPIYLISNKTNWVQAQKIVQIYTMRDPIEHLFRDQKQELGFEDNQQRLEVSVLKHWASHSSFHDGELSVAPSAIAINEPYIHTPLGRKPQEVPRALETEEIPLIVADYVKAAENAREAGFDGVEIHSANGYLLDTFLQSKTNKRNDKYGGSVENRFRILRMIVEGVTSVFPSTRVGVKIGPNTNYNDVGSPDYRETFSYVARELDRYNLAYLQIVDGTSFGFHGLGTPMKLNEFRPLFTGLLMGNCGYTKEAAELAIRDGRADLISFGRPFISNPDLVERFANDWPLNDGANPKLWYSFDTVGFTDFPTFSELQPMIEKTSSSAPQNI